MPPRVRALRVLLHYPSPQACTQRFRCSPRYWPPDSLVFVVLFALFVPALPVAFPVRSSSSATSSWTSQRPGAFLLPLRRRCSLQALHTSLTLSLVIMPASWCHFVVLSLVRVVVLVLVRTFFDVERSWRQKCPRGRVMTWRHAHDDVNRPSHKLTMSGMAPADWMADSDSTVRMFNRHNGSTLPRGSASIYSVEWRIVMLRSNAPLYVRLHGSAPCAGLE